MRAMQIIEWGKPLETREYPDPEPKGEEVLLRVEAAGVCHSDVHIWDGYFDLGEERRCLNPRTLGTRRAGGYGAHVIVPHGRYLLPHDGVPQNLAATYTCSGITAYSALKKTRGHLDVDDHLVIIGAGGVGGSAVHIAPAAVRGNVVVADMDAQKRAQARQMGAVATIDNS